MGTYRWIILGINLAISFLQFPFKFFMGKEIFFILYDELVNKGVSKNIDRLKQADEDEKHAGMVK